MTGAAPSQIWLGWAASTSSLALADLRAWPEARERLELAVSTADRMDARAQSFGALGALAWARLQTGDAAGARDAASRWDDLISEVRIPPRPGLSVLAVHLYGSGARGVGAGRRRSRRAGARRGARANRANRDPRRGRGRAPRAGGLRGGARGLGGRRCSAGGRAGGRGVRRVRDAAAGAADGADAGDGRCRAYGGCTSADRRDRSVGRGCFGTGRWVPGRGLGGTGTAGAPAPS